MKDNDNIEDVNEYNDYSFEEDEGYVANSAPFAADRQRLLMMAGKAGVPKYMKAKARELLLCNPTRFDVHIATKTCQREISRSLGYDNRWNWR